MQLKSIVIVLLLCILQITGSSTAAGVISAVSTPAGFSEQTSLSVVTTTLSIESTAVPTAIAFTKSVNKNCSNLRRASNSSGEYYTKKIRIKDNQIKPYIIDKVYKYRHFENIYKKYSL